MLQCILWLLLCAIHMHSLSFLCHSHTPLPPLFPLTITFHSFNHLSTLQISVSIFLNSCFIFCIELFLSFSCTFEFLKASCCLKFSWFLYFCIFLHLRLFIGWFYANSYFFLLKYLKCSRGRMLVIVTKARSGGEAGSVKPGSNIKSKKNIKNRKIGILLGST